MSVCYRDNWSKAPPPSFLFRFVMTEVMLIGKMTKFGQVSPEIGSKMCHFGVDTVFRKYSLEIKVFRQIAQIKKASGHTFHTKGSLS